MATIASILGESIRSSAMSRIEPFKLQSELQDRMQNSPFVQAMEMMQASPVAQGIDALQNSPISHAMQAIHDSPAVRAMIHDSSMCRAMQAIQESPSVRAIEMLRAARLVPTASVSSIDQVSTYLNQITSLASRLHDLQVRPLPLVEPVWSEAFCSVAATIGAARSHSIKSVGFDFLEVLGRVLQDEVWSDIISEVVGESVDERFSEQDSDIVGGILYDEIAHITARIDADSQSRSFADAVVEALQRTVAYLQELEISEQTRGKLVCAILYFLNIVATAIINGPIQVEYEQWRTEGEKRVERGLQEEENRLLKEIRDSLLKVPTSHQRAYVLRPVHLRVGPNSTTESYGLLQPGDEVLVIRHAGDWALVTAGMPGAIVQQGWVYSKRLKALL